jgi:DNA-binding Lrp family transcriptional regulator
LLNLLQARGGLSPREIWDGLGVSRQGAMDVLNPLLKAGLVKRIGTTMNDPQEADLPAIASCQNLWYGCHSAGF